MNKMIREIGPSQTSQKSPEPQNLFQLLDDSKIHFGIQAQSIIVTRNVQS